MIEDNGVGISQDKVENILKFNESEESGNKKVKDGHSTGIGLENVIQRIRLFSEDNNAIGIESIEGQGTKIIINIALSRGEELV